MKGGAGARSNAPTRDNASQLDSTPKASRSRGDLQDHHPPLETRIDYRCPFCDRRKANATYKLGRDGAPRWFIGCWSGRCPERGEYLQRLGDALGVGDDATLEQLAAALVA